MARTLFIASFVALLCVNAGSAATRFVAAAPTILVLQGSSNVSTWRCRGNTVDVQMSVAAPIEKINEVIDRIEDGNIAVWMSNPGEAKFPAPDFEMVIPIATFRCGNPVMESDLRHALRSERYPAIEFRFKELKGAIEHDIDRNVYQTTIAGELSMAGATREIELPVVAQRMRPDRFRIQAELPLRMSEFGITPPTALFGIVKARDELIVRFDLTLQVTS
jgi:hypothetical protein